MEISHFGMVGAILLIALPAGFYAWRTLRSLDEEPEATVDRFESGFWVGSGVALAWFSALQLALGIAFH